MNLSLRIFLLASAVTFGASVIAGCSPAGDDKSQAQIVSDSTSSVVRVETTSRYGDFVGSGFVVAGPIGVVVTAYHVIEGADKIVVRRGGAESTASIVAELLVFDKILDLALLRIPPIEQGIELSNSPLETGSPVLAMGYPLGLEGDVSVSQGIISRLVNVEGDFYVQHDAEILQGNSGGPLLGSDGKVVGVNIAVIPDVETVAGLNFAVHVGELTQLMNDAGLSPGVIVALPTHTATPTPTHTATPRPSATPRPTATPVQTPTVTPVPTPVPTLTPVELNATASVDAEILLTVVALEKNSATATAVKSTITAEATIARIAFEVDRDIQNATATVVSAKATTVVAANRTATAVAVAPKTTATAVAKTATAVARNATSTAQAVNVTATAIAVVTYCDTRPNSRLYFDPSGGTIDNTVSGKIGQGPILASSPNFEISATFYTPATGEYDFGFAFRKAGPGEMDVLSIWVNEFGVAYLNHRTTKPGDSEWTSLKNSHIGSGYGNLRTPNTLRLLVQDREGTVWLNDRNIGSLVLNRANDRNIDMNLIHGFFIETVTQSIEFDDVIVTCPSK